MTEVSTSVKKGKIFRLNRRKQALRAWLHNTT